ncbi:hypothetical protein OROHE_018025 [Orobanche hederae]
MPPAVFVIFYFAPDINRPFLFSGIIGAEYGSRQHVWVFCSVGRHGPRRIYIFERYHPNLVDLGLLVLTNNVCPKCSFSK